MPLSERVTTTVSTKGPVTLPKAICHYYGPSRNGLTTTTPP